MCLSYRATASRPRIIKAPQIDLAKKRLQARRIAAHGPDHERETIRRAEAFTAQSLQHMRGAFVRNASGPG